MKPITFAICIIGLLLAVVLLAGCATQERPTFTMLPGNVLEVNTPVTDCPPVPGGTSGCTSDVAGPVAAVCWTQSDRIPGSRQHEQSHCGPNGLRHGAWVYVEGRPCALVTQQGSTPFLAGRLLCRNANGTFSQVN